MSEAKLARLDLKARCDCGLFFVSTKNPLKLRVVIDARRAGTRFKKPPWCSVSSVETLCRVRVCQGRTVFTAQEDIKDIKDFFFRLDIDSKLSQHFGLPRKINALWVDAFRMSGVTAPSELDLRDPFGKVEPCLSVLPMGFSWDF